MDDSTLSKLTDSKQLLEFLKGNSGNKIIKMPSSYELQAEFIIAMLIKEPIKIKKKISLTVGKIFLAEYNKFISLRDGVKLNRNECATLLLNILWLIEFLPTNQETSDEIISHLLKMIDKNQFQEWPDKFFKAILLALISLISKSEFHSLKLHEVVLIFEKIKNQDYFNYFGLIFCIIMRIDIDYAIDMLPDLLATLNSANHKHKSFLIDIIVQIGEDKDRWRKIGCLLREKNFTQELGVLRIMLRYWGKIPNNISNLL